MFSEWVASVFLRIDLEKGERRLGPFDSHECQVVEVVETATANHSDEHYRSALSHRRRSNRALKLPSSEVVDIVLEQVQLEK